LTRLAGGPAQVFADSGAFSEFRTQHVIPPLEWERRLAIYADLAMALGRQLFCVAPDHVADQRATLARMECYAKPVQRLAGLGANVLLPVQGGEMSMAAFWRRQLAVMGAGAWIAGIPCCAAATTPEALAAFVREARPQRVHLLGVGPTGKTFPAYLAAVRACGVDVGLSCDSGRLRALVGRQSGVRPLTAERDRWVREGHEVDDVEGLKVLQFKCHLLEQQRRAYEAAFGPQDLGVVLPDGSAWRPRTAFNEEPSAGAEAFTKAELGYYAWRRVGEAASQAQKRVGGEVM